jgi:hypothetical protein
MELSARAIVRQQNKKRQTKREKVPKTFPPPLLLSAPLSFHRPLYYICRVSTTNTYETRRFR